MKESVLALHARESINSSRLLFSGLLLLRCTPQPSGCTHGAVKGSRWWRSLASASTAEKPLPARSASSTASAARSSTAAAPWTNLHPVLRQDHSNIMAIKQRTGGVQLPLTGPYHAISADGCVAIVLDLQNRRHNTASPTPSSSYGFGDILLDVYAETTKYDEAITSVVSSTSGDCQAEVSYALLRDAAEAVVEVRLQTSGIITGTVVACTNVGVVVLFDNDDDGERVGVEGVVPLARSVVAVPMTSSLTVEVDLLVDGGDGEGVKESVVFVPKLGSEEVSRRQAGAVEVNVTWLVD